MDFGPKKKKVGHKKRNPVYAAALKPTNLGYAHFPPRA